MGLGRIIAAGTLIESACAVIILTCPLVTFNYITHITDGVDVGIPLEVGLTKCFSQVCSFFSSTLTSMSSIKHPFDDTAFEPPKIYMSDVRNDPQGRYFYYASILSITSIAVAITMMATAFWRVLDRPSPPPSTRRLALVSLSLNFLSPLLYVLTTLPVVASRTKIQGGDPGPRGLYSWELYLVLAISFGLLVTSPLTLASSSEYSVIPEVDDLDVESHNSEGARRTKGQPWRTGRGSPAKGMKKAMV